MTVTLNGISLSDEMTWEEQYDSWSVAQNQTRTLGGRPVINSAQLKKGRPITLFASNEQGWDVLTYDKIKLLLAMAETPAAVYSLVIASTTYNVMFRHHEPPAFEVAPLIQKLEPLDTDFFRARIKLMTV